MALGQKRNNPIVTQAGTALESFKYEVASELGIDNSYKTGYWGNISSRECGAVGGHMVRRMIAAAEQSLAEQAAGQTKQAFRQMVGSSFPLEPDASGGSQAHNPNERGQYGGTV